MEKKRIEREAEREGEAKGEEEAYDDEDGITVVTKLLKFHFFVVVTACRRESAGTKDKFVL